MVVVMSSSAGSYSKNYVSFLLKKVAEAYQKLGDDELVGFAMYYSEKQRKKPGLLRRKGERIKTIGLVFYPFLLRQYARGVAVLIDSLKVNKFTASYGVLDKDAIESEIRELSKLSGKSFLDGLVRMSKLTQSIAKGEAGVREEKIELDGVVSDVSFISKLKTFIEYTASYELPFLELPFPTVKHEVVVGEISKALDEIDELMKYVNSVVERIEDMLGQWRRGVRGEYEEKLRRIDEKIEETRQVVARNVDELRKKKEEELANIRERYQPHIEAVEKRIVETREDLRKLEEEIEKAKSYGRDASDLKKRLNELKKTLKALEEELGSEKASYDREVGRIEKKYNELVEAENNKVRSLINEREGVQRELESILQDADRRFDEIRGYLQEYRERLAEAEKTIEKISLPVPSGGEGLYLIPLIYTQYVSGGSTRSTITTPVVLEPGGKLGPRVKVIIHEEIANYMSWVKTLLDKEEMKPDVESNNLLWRVPIERIEVSLNRLAEIGLFGREEASEIVRRLEEQREMR